MGLGINYVIRATNTAWVRTRVCKLQTKRCTRLAATSDKAYQLLAHGRWFSLGTPASSTTKTGRHDIAESGVIHQKSINQSINHVIRANHLVSLITSSTTDPSCLAIAKLKIYSKEFKTIHFSSFGILVTTLKYYRKLLAVTTLSAR